MRVDEWDGWICYLKHCQDGLVKLSSRGSPVFPTNVVNHSLSVHPGFDFVPAVGHWVYAVAVAVFSVHFSSLLQNIDNRKQNNI